MSPTVFRSGGYRFHFFSREESRPHVHVDHPDGEAKVRLDPTITISHNPGLTRRQVATILRLTREHENEIRKAWTRHFGR